LIELLVVVAIISLLSSVVFASLNTARAKARDARRISDLKQVQTALFLYYDKYGFFPNYSGQTTTHTQKFNLMAQDLVDDGFLSAVPAPPSSYSTYQYYLYGGSTLGALLVTNLEAYPNSSTGYPGSCRYNWGVGASNWCSINHVTSYYCLCNLY